MGFGFGGGDCWLQKNTVAFWGGVRFSESVWGRVLGGIYGRPSRLFFLVRSFRAIWGVRRNTVWLVFNPSVLLTSCCLMLLSFLRGLHLGKVGRAIFQDLPADSHEPFAFWVRKLRALGNLQFEPLKRDYL